MAVERDTKELYNNQADEWNRKEPILLSDYSARPFVLNICEPLAGKNILDIGCGEGYVGREMLKRGAQHVHGIDLSEKMIELAVKEKEKQQIQNATYVAQNISDLSVDNHEQYDLVIAMFLFNYLSIEETQSTMEKVFLI